MLYRLEYAGKEIGTYSSWRAANTHGQRMLEVAESKLLIEKMSGSLKGIIQAHTVLRRVRHGIQIVPVTA